MADMKTELQHNELVETLGSALLPTATGGDLALAAALVAEGALTRAAVNPLLQRLQLERGAAVKDGQTLTLLDLLVSEQLATLEDLLSIIVDRSGFPYMPLATYDVDRDVACLLPRDLAFEFCLIPFDRISRSVLIAVANPLDPAIRDRIRVLIDYDLFWYVSAPAEITSALRRAHDLDKAEKVAEGERAKA